jgi:glutamine amidotransferase
MTDGEQLVALRFRSHHTQQPPSLYWTDKAGVVLNRKFDGPNSNGTTGRKKEEHGNHLIVASEPTTKTEVAEWHVIEKNSLVIRGKNEEVQLEGIAIDWEKELGLKNV